MTVDALLDEGNSQRKEVIPKKDFIKRERSLKLQRLKSTAVENKLTDMKFYV